MESMRRWDKVRRFYILCVYILLVGPGTALCSASEIEVQPRRAWTVIQYVAGDNNAARFLGKTLNPLKSSIGSHEAGLNWVLLVDLAKGYGSYSDVFGEDFVGTRIYELQRDKFIRRGGGDILPQITTTSATEANTADAKTLRDFIRFAKKYYPADHYALIILSHGTGPYFAPDESHGEDVMYTPEVTDVLTGNESVDLMILDLCSMASIENFYQWRPGNGGFSTPLVIASAPSSESPDYGELVNRITAGKMKSTARDLVVGGNKVSYRPEELTPRVFATIVLSDLAESDADKSWGMFDIGKAEALKKAFDELAVTASEDSKARVALEQIRGKGSHLVTMTYLPGAEEHASEDLSWLQGYGGDKSWLHCPCLDVYDFASRVAASTSVSDSMRSAGRKIKLLSEQMTVYSFGSREHWRNFEAGRNGVYFVFPDGELRLEGMRAWDLMKWYSSDDVRSSLAADDQAIAAQGQTKPPSNVMKLLKFQRMAYGRLSWAQDGAHPEGQGVGNWYQLMESWYGRRQND
jgi:clostripain